jgi:hypothetical protein
MEQACTNPVLGHDLHIGTLRERLKQGNLKKAIIRGPSGSGKSEIARNTFLQAQHWMHVVWLAGNGGRTQEGYSAIHSALNGWNPSGIISQGKKILSAAASDFLPVGKSLAKAVIDMIPTMERGESGRPADVVAAEFLSMAARYTAHGKLLIVIDDIQYVDEKSLLLIEEASNISPKISFIITQNTQIKPTHDGSASYKKLISTPTIIDLSYCSREQFLPTLRAMGLRAEVSDDLVDLLYQCSGGHLHISRLIVDELNSSADEIAGAARKKDDLLHFAIQRRLCDGGALSDVIEEVLSGAAAIGHSFSSQELKCLFSKHSASMPRAVQLAEQMGLVRTSHEQVQFGHDVVRNYFAQHGAEQAPTHNAKFSQCLRMLRPGNYHARAVALQRAGDMGRGIDVACQALVADWRLGQRTAADIKAVNPALPDAPVPIQSFLHSMRDGYEKLARGDYVSALHDAHELHSGLPPVLCAERDYLIAECLLKDLGFTASKKAKDLLERWNTLKEPEPELWCRMRMLLLLAYTQLCQHNLAMEVARGLGIFLSAREKYDPDALRQNLHLLSLSDMFLEAENSRRCLQLARQSYEARLNDGGHADLYGFYICLTNSAGNAITRNVFGDAITFASRALAIIREAPLIRFTAPWAPANNAIAALMLGGKISVKHAAKCQSEILVKFSDVDDALLLRNNLACFLWLSDRRRDGLKMFRKNLDRISDTPDIDPLYRYLTESNRAIAIAQECPQEGQRLFQSLAALVDTLPPALQPQLRERHACFGAGMRWMPQTSAVNTLFPKGLMLTDIQIWSAV